MWTAAHILFWAQGKEGHMNWDLYTRRDRIEAVFYQP
jgi:hypothetical protein